MSDRPTPQAIGMLLLRRGLVTQTQLQQALDRQRATGAFLGAILVEEGIIQPQALLETLSEQFGIPHEPLSPSMVDWRIAGQFPPSCLAEGKCFPIRGDEETITVAIANPLDAGALSSMERAAKYRHLKPVLVLDQELKAVHRAHQQYVLKHLGQRLTPHGDDHKLQ